MFRLPLQRSLRPQRSWEDSPCRCTRTSSSHTAELFGVTVSFGNDKSCFGVAWWQWIQKYEYGHGGVLNQENFLNPVIPCVCDSILIFLCVGCVCVLPVHEQRNLAGTWIYLWLFLYVCSDVTRCVLVLGHVSQVTNLPLPELCSYGLPSAETPSCPRRLHLGGCGQSLEALLLHWVIIYSSRLV